MPATTRGERVWGHMAGWGIIASLMEILSAKYMQGHLPWTGRIVDQSLGGEPVAALLFLLRMLFETVTVGFLNVFLSLLLFRWVGRTRLKRWAGLAVVAGNILVSGWILWVFIETWNDHGYIVSVEERVADASPLVAAMLFTGLSVALRQHALRAFQAAFRRPSPSGEEAR